MNISSNDRLIKEWEAMLTYVSGSYTGTIKNLSKINNLEYNRCIKINKVLNKKENKIAYAELMINKYKNQKQIVEAILSVTISNEPRQDEPMHNEPRQDEPIHDEPIHDEPMQDEPRQDEPMQDEDDMPSLEPIYGLNFKGEYENIEYISKKEFQEYKNYMEEIIEHLVLREYDLEKNHQLFTEVMTTVSLVIYILCFISFMCIIINNT